MKQIILLISIFSLFSCQKRKEIDVFNNDEINNVISELLQNTDSESSLIFIKNTKYIGNELSKDSLILKNKNFMISKVKLDSLISPEDWKFIKDQIEDKRKYFINESNFSQKVLNSDSLKNENLKFSKQQMDKIDSLREIDLEKARIYISQTSQSEYYKYLENSTPISYIDKPLFTKNKKRMIFSFYTYSGPLSALSEIAIYELRNNKWIKIETLYITIS